MSSIIQSLVDEGVFDEDPDGHLWLSSKMRDVVTKLEENDKFLRYLREIENQEKRSRMRWIVLYMNFKEAATAEELADAVDALSAWEMAILSNRLDEWSMKLRLL